MKIISLSLSLRTFNSDRYFKLPYMPDYTQGDLVYKMGLAPCRTTTQHARQNYLCVFQQFSPPFKQSITMIL